jgi:hypothetical protein
MNMYADIFGNPAALAAAILGATCYVTWPLCRTRSRMLTVQLGIGIGFGIHYALMGAATAAIANTLGSLQVASSMLLPKSRGLRWISYVPVVVMIIACIVTWNGAPSLFATLGTVLIAIGRSRSDAHAMRMLVTAGSPFWLVHDLMMHSPIAIVDFASLVMGIYAIHKHGSFPRFHRPMPGVRRSPL